MKRLLNSLKGIATEKDKLLREHENRLQRAVGTDGFRITSFQQVAYRHGLFMAVLAAICFFQEQARDLLLLLTNKGISDPIPYVTAICALLVFFVVGTKIAGKQFDRIQGLWIVYLFMISAMEEWIFRCALPQAASLYLPFMTGVVLSNLIFAAIHYFTLRWKIERCLLAFLGGMGLNSLVMHKGDLFLLIGVHWIATFINTPQPPAGSGDG